MSGRVNEFGQPIGQEVPGWTERQRPSRQPTEGRYCRIEPLSAKAHARQLFEAYSADTTGELWTYMSVEPFETLEQFTEWTAQIAGTTDPFFHTIIDKSTGKAVGMVAYLRIEPKHGVIEVGHIAYSPALQRTAAATEAMYLMMKRVFSESGYRRYEWKCDALNAASRRAAERYGFTYDGLFEQALVHKGRNRDTAWYSILDRDWPQIEQAYEAWLDPGNFDGKGAQRQRLADLIAQAR